MADFCRGQIAPQTALMQAAFSHSSTNVHSIDQIAQQIICPTDCLPAASPRSTSLGSWLYPTQSSFVIPYFDCFLSHRSFIDFASPQDPYSSRSKETH